MTKNKAWRITKKTFQVEELPHKLYWEKDKKQKYDMLLLTICQRI